MVWAILEIKTYSTRLVEAFFLLPSYGKFIMVIWVKASVKLHNRTKWYSAVNKGKHRVGIKHGLKFKYSCYANSIYVCINEQTK